jgi:Cys-tRNA synthase (O-phospho-L-seryl-tRNA:Cys-tRNA synthase)
MTPEQSKQLKVGTRVCFNGDPADSGKVISIEARYVTIKWGDGHQSFTGNNAMDRVQLVEPPKVKRK